MSSLSIQSIEKIIYEFRGQKVMMDSDLAELYGVSTRDLLRQVKRNITRFPEDFMFIPNSSELEELRCQSGTANGLSNWNHMRRTTPMFFTENRVFTKLRSFLAIENENSRKVDKLEKETKTLFKIVFEKMDNFEKMVTPKLSPTRKKIGLKE